MINPAEVDIHELLPQQEPFVAVDQLVYFSELEARTLTKVREDSLFVENGKLSAAGIIENIAQTCAAKIGFYNKYILKNDVQIGVIGAIRDLVINFNPSAGSLVETTVTAVEEVFGMTLVTAIVETSGEKVATCNMKIAIDNRRTNEI